MSQSNKPIEPATLYVELSRSASVLILQFLATQYAMRSAIAAVVSQIRGAIDFGAKQAHSASLSVTEGSLSCSLENAAANSLCVKVSTSDWACKSWLIERSCRIFACFPNLA